MRALVPLALLGLILAAPAARAAETEKPAYCVNLAGDFYPYPDGGNCKAGYQLAQGNCRLKNGQLIAVNKAGCARMSGDLALPAPAVLFNDESDPNKPKGARPLTTRNPKP